VRLADVWLRYRRRGPWVLRGVTAQLNPGEAATIVGPNGAGKSTLLNLAAGLLRPTHGLVTGRPARVGFVPERFPADQPFTARRYLTSMAKVQGLTDPAQRIGALADRLRLTPLLDTLLPELSKGSAQKVGLIQAMLIEPELLILDEPWEGLDARTRDEVPLIIAEILAAGRRVLVSDHFGQTAELPGIRVWELVDGKLVDEGTDADATCVVELVVKADEVASTVAELRSAGHHVNRVRAADREDLESWQDLARSDGST